MESLLDIFLKKAIEKHGNKYDYSKVEYVNRDTKIKIICPIHGEFIQTPTTHLANNGCRICSSISKSLGTEEFIKRSIEKHGERYDYSLVDYKNKIIKVKIICPEHGEFLQRPSNHLNSDGCLECARCKKSLNTEEFIEKSKEIHGEKYNYSKVEYKNQKDEIIIICKEHGEFLQIPNVHLRGNGCPICARSSRKSTTKEFIERSIKVHEDKYNYSKVNYIDCETPVIIICKKHGEFLQSPYNHYKGSGCNQCAIESHHQNQPYTTEKFISIAKSIHGDKYDYSLVDYKLANKKVKIICPKHGIFKQVPNSHLSGNGCPICKQYKGERYISLYLKNYKIKYKPQYSDKKCIHKKELKFDFGIKINNKLILIEYNGLQHYKSIEWFGGDKSFESSQIRDNIKKEFCINNKIDLIILDYKINTQEKIIKYLDENLLPLYLKYK